MIDGLDEQDLESPIEGNALQNGGGIHSGTTTNYEEMGWGMIRL